MHFFDNVAAEIESESGTFGHFLVTRDAIKLAEKLRQRVSWNTKPVIANRNDNLACERIKVDFDFDVPTIGRVFQRVRNEIENDLLEQTAVGRNLRPWRRSRECERDPAPLCFALLLVDADAAERRNIGVREIRARNSALNAADVEHVIAKSQGGTDSLANLQTLCHRCPALKTWHEDRVGGGFVKLSARPQK